MTEIGGTMSHYKILEKLGEGGMGVVYRAEDTNLGRQVAVKVLPELFSGDPERLARFEREARLLASLNHPNIATIHGLEQAEGKLFLVMELVEGETLAQRLLKGPLPVEEALEVCRQIAEGLESAHEKGVIHRDLKPANIKITPDGKVKILDFGLAKAFREETAAADLSHSPTLTAAMTRAGVILGTAAYMSPEQAKGKPVDKRTDIWAFGCVLYECLTGKRAFEGETVTETLAAVLTRDPSWDLLAPATPWRVKDLLHRCLERNITERLRDIGEARIDLRKAVDKGEAPEHESFTSKAEGKPRIPWIAAASIGLAAIIIGVIAAFLWLRVFAPAPNGELTSLNLALSVDHQIYHTKDWLPLTISRDGRILAWWGGPPGKHLIYTRALSTNEIRSIPLTAAIDPFSISFSPDSDSIAFTRENELWKVRLSDGVPVKILPSISSNPIWYADWADDDSIVVAPTHSGLYRIEQDGSNPKLLTTLETASGEVSHERPQVLPGSRAVLFSVGVGNWHDCHIEVLSLETGKRHKVIDDANVAQYLPTGHLVFARDEVLYAKPFNLEKLEVTGGEQPLFTGIAMDEGAGRVGAYAVSTGGTLVNVPVNPKARLNRLAWVDRQGGAPSFLVLPPGGYLGPRICQDGSRVAVSHASGHRFNIEIIDLARGISSPLTRAGSSNESPVWSPNCGQIAFGPNRERQWNLFVQPSDGNSDAKQLQKSAFIELPESWSPDGRYLLFSRRVANDDRLLHLLDMNQPDTEEVPLSEKGSQQVGARFSPDGRLIAYADSKEQAVYAMEFDPASPQRGRTHPVSRSQVTEPVWSPKGDRLFYRSLDGTRLYSVSINPKALFSIGKEVEEHVIPDGLRLSRGYDITPDGKRFLMSLSDDPSDQSMNLVVVTNWFEELKRLFPTGK